MKWNSLYISDYLLWANLFKFLQKKSIFWSAVNPGSTHPLPLPQGTPYTLSPTPLTPAPTPIRPTVHTHGPWQLPAMTHLSKTTVFLFSFLPPSFNPLTLPWKERDRDSERKREAVREIEWPRPLQIFHLLFFLQGGLVCAHQVSSRSPDYRYKRWVWPQDQFSLLVALFNSKGKKLPL